MPLMLSISQDHKLIPLERASEYILICSGCRHNSTYMFDFSLSWLSKVSLSLYICKLGKKQHRANLLKCVVYMHTLPKCAFLSLSIVYLAFLDMINIVTERKIAISIHTHIYPVVSLNFENVWLFTSKDILQIVWISSYLRRIIILRGSSVRICLNW